jgi:hypothetical protein
VTLNTRLVGQSRAVFLNHSPSAQDCITPLAWCCRFGFSATSWRGVEHQQVCFEVALQSRQPVPFEQITMMVML